MSARAILASGGEASALFIAEADNNVYIRRNAQTPEQAVGWSWGKSKPVHAAYPTLNAFRTAAREAGLQHETNSLENTPLDTVFVDPDAADFRLKPVSLLVGKAAPLPADIAAATGRSAGWKTKGALAVGI